MYKIEGYWDIVPQIKNVSFPSRGKMQVDLEDGRSILVDVAKFPSIKKLSLKDRRNWYKMDNGFSFEKCSEVIHIEQILGNFQKYRHESDPKDPYGIPNVNFSVIDNFVPKKLVAEYKQQRIERGFDDTECWNLDLTFSGFILPRLIQFKKDVNGYPEELGTFENWGAVIDKMIFAFDHIYNREAYSKALDKQFQIDRSGMKMDFLSDGTLQITDPNREINAPREKKKDAAEREIFRKVNEGLKLFAKYFRDLWW